MSSVVLLPYRSKPLLQRQFWQSPFVDSVTGPSLLLRRCSKWLPVFARIADMSRISSSIGT